MSPRRYCIWSDPIDCLGDHVLRCSYRAFRHSQLPLSTSSSLVNHPSIAISKASFLSFVPLLLMKIPGVHMIPHIAHSGPHPSAILIDVTIAIRNYPATLNCLICQQLSSFPWWWTASLMTSWSTSLSPPTLLTFKPFQSISVALQSARAHSISVAYGPPTLQCNLYYHTFPCLLWSQMSRIIGVYMYMWQSIA